MEKKLSKRIPLKKVIRNTVYKVIFTTILITILIYIVMFSLIKFISLMPANTIENDIKIISDYIKENNLDLSTIQGKKELNSQIKSSLIKYQIINTENVVVGGNIKEPIFTTSKDVLNILNKGEKIDDYFYRVDPFFSNDTYKGAIIFKYKLKLLYKEKYYFNENIILLLGIILPIIILILSVYIFTKKLWRYIQAPLENLMYATKQIKQENLDFQIESIYNDELGDLTKSINDVKNELKESLKEQWLIKEQDIEMTQALAHDLKTPISVVASYSEVLRDNKELDNKKQEEYINTIYHNSEKAIYLLNQLENLSNIDQTIWETEIILMDTITEEIKYLYKEICNDKNIRLKIELEQYFTKNSIIIKNMNPQNMRMIIHNLVDNAIRYSPIGGIIKIDVIKDLDIIKIRVCDDGKGVLGGDEKKIFNKFYQGDKSRQSETRNYGLGLYFVKQIVENANGKVFYDKNYSIGTCFEINFNLDK